LIVQVAIMSVKVFFNTKDKQVVKEDRKKFIQIEQSITEIITE